jgi:hypothetical protein
LTRKLQKRVVLEVGDIATCMVPMKFSLLLPEDDYEQEANQVADLMIFWYSVIRLYMMIKPTPICKMLNVREWGRRLLAVEHTQVMQQRDTDLVS